MASTILVEGPITFEVRGENVHMRNADGSIRVAMSRHDFLAGVQASKAIVQQIGDANSVARVLKFKKRSGEH